MGVFKNNQITLFLCFTFIPKTGISFYCVPFAIIRYTVKRLVPKVWRRRVEHKEIKNAPFMMK